MNREISIQVKGLSFTYPGSDKTILSNINLEVNQGDFIAIIGQNGAGKTTLTKHFNGLHSPVHGDVYINGNNTKELNMNQIIRLVGYCYQNPDHQLFSRSVYDEVCYGPKNLGYTSSEIEEKVMEALRVTNLIDKKDEYPFTLGRGERQRIAISSVISMGSPILIVDEPTTGLDTKGAEDIMNFLTKWNEMGHTVIVVTHDIEMVARFVPKTIVMANGQIIEHGDTRKVFQQKEILEKAFVKQPQITRIASEINQLAEFKSILTVEEMVDLIKKIKPIQQINRLKGGIANGGGL